MLFLCEAVNVIGNVFSAGLARQKRQSELRTLRDNTVPDLREPCIPMVLDEAVFQWNGLAWIPCLAGEMLQVLRRVLAHIA